MPSCYLLLDFDGVLHPKYSEPSSYFMDRPALETVLREFPDVVVVIASSWRHTRSLEALRALFSADLQSRIVGVTPDVPPPPGASDHGSRHREVEAWLAAYGEPGVPWLALEDVVHLYDSGAPLVITPDGFGAPEAEALRRGLADPCAFAERCFEQAAAQRAIR